jgi:hypothetical protein
MSMFRLWWRNVLAQIIVSAIGIGGLGREQMLDIAFGPVTCTPMNARLQ